MRAVGLRGGVRVEGHDLRTDRLGDFPVKGNNQKGRPSREAASVARQLRVPWAPDLVQFPGRG